MFFFCLNKLFWINRTDYEQSICLFRFVQILLTSCQQFVIHRNWCRFQSGEHNDNVGIDKMNDFAVLSYGWLAHSGHWSSSNCRFACSLHTGTESTQAFDHLFTVLLHWARFNQLCCTQLSHWKLNAKSNRIHNELVICRVFVIHSYLHCCCCCCLRFKNKTKKNIYFTKSNPFVDELFLCTRFRFFKLKRIFARAHAPHNKLQ